MEHGSSECEIQGVSQCPFMEPFLRLALYEGGCGLRTAGTRDILLQLLAPGERSPSAPGYIEAIRD